MSAGKYIVLSFLAASAVFPQKKGASARELYYEGMGPGGGVEVPAVKPAVTPVPTPRPSGKKRGTTSATNTTSTRPAVPVVNAALRLGLRYNLMLIDDIKTGRSHEVDPDQNFKTGDCFQVRLRPNRGGSMYVFNQGSSGSLHLLLPSESAPDEPTSVEANHEITVAHDHCFRLDDRKGVDKLIVAISDREEDIEKFDAPRRKEPPQTDGLLAMRRVTAVTGPPLTLVSRDMTVEKIGAASKDDPAHAVYVVKNAASPSDHMIIEIPIRHE